MAANGRLYAATAPAEAEEAARRAVALLEAGPPGRALATAYGTLSYLAMLADDTAAVAAWGSKAFELAERLGANALAADAQMSLAIAGMYADPGDAFARLEHALDLVRDAGAERPLARAFTALASMGFDQRRFEFAGRTSPKVSTTRRNGGSTISATGC